MRTTVKTLWICIILMLTCSVGGQAFDHVVSVTKLAAVFKVSVSSSLSSATSNNIQQRTSLFANTKFAWTTDMELGSKPISESSSPNQQRLRRILEDNLFLRNILLILSNHENLLVQGRAKLYYSDKAPCHALTGSDYYIYTLRRILI